MFPKDKWTKGWLDPHDDMDQEDEKPNDVRLCKEIHEVLEELLWGERRRFTHDEMVRHVQAVFMDAEKKVPSPMTIKKTLVRLSIPDGESPL